MPNRLIKLNSIKRNPITFLAQGNSLSYQDKNGTGTLTATGALRYQPGSGGRVNLLPNGNMEVSAAWFGGGMTTSYVTEQFLYGAKSLKAVATAASGTVRVVAGFGSNASRIQSGTPYTGSVYVYNASSGNRDIAARHEWINNDGTAGLGSVSGTTTTCPPGVWTRLSVTGTAPTGAQRDAFQAVFSTTTNPVQVGDVFYFDGALVESGSQLLDFFDGASPGCVWADFVTGLPGSAGTVTSLSKAAFWVEETTTNLIKNPSAEIAIGGTEIRALGTISTITRDTTCAYVGTTSIKCVTGGGSGTEGVRFESAKSLGYTGSARTFTASAYVRGTGNLRCSLVIVYTDTSALELLTTFTATDTWQRIVSPAGTLDPAKTVDYIAVDVRQQATTAGTFFVDAAQAEEKAYVTSYCDGSLGSGYTWAGTAHASASTRASTTIKTAPGSRVSGMRGSAVTLFNSLYSPGGVNGYIWSAGSSGSLDFIGQRLTTSVRQLEGVFYTGGTSSIQYKRTGGVPLNAWHTSYLDWDGQATAMSLDAEASFTASTRTIQANGTISTGAIAIGNLSDGITFQINGTVGPLAFFDRPLTQAEILILQTTDPVDWWNALA